MTPTMGPSGPYYVDPWDDGDPHHPQAGPSMAGTSYPNTDPYDDNYPGPVVQSSSNIDPGDQGPYLEPLSPSRNHERSHTPSSVNGDLRSNAAGGLYGALSKCRKRERPHKKKKARADAPASVVYSESSVPTPSPAIRHTNSVASDCSEGSCLPQMDCPVHIPHRPTPQVVPDSSAAPSPQYFLASDTSYATILCREAAHWSTTHQEDIPIPTSAPSRILPSDILTFTPSTPKHIQVGVMDPPRKLVVLDLNGTLLWRSSLKAGTGRRKTFRRPYVGVLAQYLAHERTTQTMVVEPGRPAVPLELYAAEEVKFPSRRGSREDGVTILAPLDAMIWSSVQPRNVEDMVDVTFGSLQTALRAVWTRSMIGLSQAEYHQKVQTIKDLRRVWWDTQGAYTAETTALVDDSPFKARLQPHNLLLIPEYQRKMDPGLDPDRVLLAVIGVLEEMRSQASIPAWTCNGGLWGTKGRPISTTAIEEGGNTKEAIVQATHKDTEGGSQDIESGMFLSGASAAPELATDAPQWWEDKEAIQHWVERAGVVLNEMSIPIVPGILNPREDPIG